MVSSVFNLILTKDIFNFFCHTVFREQAIVFYDLIILCFSLTIPFNKIKLILSITLLSYKSQIRFKNLIQLHNI